MTMMIVEKEEEGTDIGSEAMIIEEMIVGSPASAAHMGAPPPPPPPPLPDVSPTIETIQEFLKTLLNDFE